MATKVWITDNWKIPCFVALSTLVRWATMPCLPRNNESWPFFFPVNFFFMKLKEHVTKCPEWAGTLFATLLDHCHLPERLFWLLAFTFINKKDRANQEGSSWRYLGMPIRKGHFDAILVWRCLGKVKNEVPGLVCHQGPPIYATP